LGEIVEGLKVPVSEKVLTENLQDEIDLEDI
jgi:hypothetical protein